MTDLPELANYATGTWQVNTVHSYIGFTIKHMMVSKVRGRFTGFTASFSTAENPLESIVSATIEVTSIDTQNSMRDDHIRSADFLDAANHPTLTFASTGIRFEDGAIPGGGVTLGDKVQITLDIEADLQDPKAEEGEQEG
jgi:polyisoprenoid-binding protein YceI